MQGRILIIYSVDLVLLFISFLIMAVIKEGTPNYLSYRYLTGFGVLIVSWTIFSFYFKKYRFKQKYGLNRIIKNILLANIGSISILAMFMIAFNVSGYSRLIFFGTAIIGTAFELVLGNLYFFLIHTRDTHTDLYNPPAESLRDPESGKGHQLPRHFPVVRCGA